MNQSQHKLANGWTVPKGTLLNHLELGQQLVGVLKHALYCSMLVGQVLGAGLLGGAAGLADNGRRPGKSARVANSLYSWELGLLRASSSLAHGQGVVHKINLISVVLHGIFLPLKF